MAKLQANRGIQYPLVAEFTFTMADTMANTSGSVVAFNAAGSATFEPIKLPYGAVVIGGDVVVGTASNDATTATVSVGDSANATRYLGATSIKSAARTALVPTGLVSDGSDVRITVANGTGGASAGSVTVRVMYTIGGRAHEVQPN